MISSNETYGAGGGARDIRDCECRFAREKWTHYLCCDLSGQSYDVMVNGKAL